MYSQLADYTICEWSTECAKCADKRTHAGPCAQVCRQCTRSWLTVSLQWSNRSKFLWLMMPARWLATTPLRQAVPPSNDASPTLMTALKVYKSTTARTSHISYLYICLLRVSITRSVACLGRTRLLYDTFVFPVLFFNTSIAVTFLFAALRCRNITAAVHGSSVPEHSLVYVCK